MQSRAQIVLWLSLLLTLGLSTHYFYFQTYSFSIPDSAFRLHSTSLDQAFPRKIWQTWRQSAQALGKEQGQSARTWLDMNTAYEYELLTDDSAQTYVQKEFSKARPDISDTFGRIVDPILRADYTRYLALLRHGGLYTDIDTDCKRKIDDWVPDEYKNKTGLVVGVEYDAMEGETRGDMDLRVQFCQWTIMAKPGNAAMQHVVDRVTEELEGLDNGLEITMKGNPRNVLDVTGPRVRVLCLLASTV